MENYERGNTDGGECLDLKKMDEFLLKSGDVLILQFNFTQYSNVFLSIFDQKMRSLFDPLGIHIVYIPKGMDLSTIHIHQGNVGFSTELTEKEVTRQYRMIRADVEKVGRTKKGDLSFEDENMLHFLKEQLLRNKDIVNKLEEKIIDKIREECKDCDKKSFCWNSIFSSMTLVGGRCLNKGVSSIG